MQDTLFSSLISGAHEAPAAAPALACSCGACGGAGGNIPSAGDYATTPSDNAYRFVAQAAAQGNAGSVASLMAGSKWSSVDAASAKTIVTYSFADPATSVFNYGANSDFAATLTAFSQADRALVRELLARVEAVCNVQFVEVADNATECGVIRYGYSNQPAAMNYAGYAFYPSASAIGGDVWIDTQQSQAGWDFYRPNLLLHETLHALGLKHPFSGSAVLASGENIIPNTVMSYSPVAGASGTLSTYPAEPMAYDVAALQYLYGAAQTNAADTVYDLASAELQAGFQCIWDAGGNDTLDASRIGRGVALDLADGARSEIGNAVTAQAWRSDGSTVTTSYRGTLTLANGAAIENAAGSEFADRLDGNGLANRLVGAGGNDVIDGRGGIDTAVYRGAADGYAVARTASGLTVSDLRGADGTDQLANVERLQFADHGLAFDLDGHAGTVARILGTVFGAESVHNLNFVTIGLALADQGWSAEAMTQLALNFRQGATAPAAAVTEAMQLAGSDAMAQQIDLVGLAAHGLAYAA